MERANFKRPGEEGHPGGGGGRGQRLGREHGGRFRRVRALRDLRARRGRRDAHQEGHHLLLAARGQEGAQLPPARAAAQAQEAQAHPRGHRHRPRLPEGVQGHPQARPGDGASGHQPADALDAAAQAGRLAGRHHGLRPVQPGGQAGDGGLGPVHGGGHLRHHRRRVRPARAHRHPGGLRLQAVARLPAHQAGLHEDAGGEPVLPEPRQQPGRGHAPAGRGGGAGMPGDDPGLLLPVEARPGRRAGTAASSTTTWRWNWRAG